MNSFAYVLAFDPPCHALLAQHTDAGWVLPGVVSRPRERSASRIGRWLQSLHIQAHLVHASGVIHLADDDCTTEYYAYVVQNAGVTSWRWLDAYAVLPPDQALVASTARDRLRFPSAPFDSPAACAQSLEWIDANVRPASLLREHPPTRFRYSRNDAVAICETTAGAVVFKGGLHRVCHERPVGDALAALSPQHFSHTLAADVTLARWLTTTVPGLPLSAEPTADALATVGRTMGRLQQAALLSPAVQRAIPDVMTPFEIYEAGTRLQALFCSEVSGVGQAPLFDATSFRSALDRTCDALTRLDLPRTWIHSDLNTSNIFFNKGAPYFIDLEDALFGVAPLTLWPLICDLERIQRKELRQALEDGYVNAWSSEVDPHQMQTALKELPIAGRVALATVRWRRAERHWRDYTDRPVSMARLRAATVPLARGLSVVI